MADTNEQEEMTRNYVNNDSNFDLDVTSVDAIILCGRTFNIVKVYRSTLKKRAGKRRDN